MRDAVAAHGFEDVVGDEGFLFQIEPGVFQTPAGVGICGEMVNAVNALEMRRGLFQIQQVEFDDFQARIPGVLRQMLAAAR